MRRIAYVTIACLAVSTVLVNLFPWVRGGEAGAPAKFEVPPGATLRDVAKILSDKDLIANRDVFVIGAVLLGLDRTMAAGTYAIEPKTGLLSLYSILSRGQHLLNLVTVPEGLTLSQTTDLLSGRLGLDAGELELAARDPELLASLGIEGDSAEGYLFPDTYDIHPRAKARDIISTMVHRALQVYSEVRLEAASPPELGTREVFILASIVEAEVTMHEEAPRVAAVFLNRLQKGMPLQADPTVAYALGGNKPRITYRDLEIDSPYNTYRYSGLPPGPICSPGESSLRAVLNPRKPSKEMYFVARGDGSHVFSETMDEHLRAKQLIRSGKAGS
jgi:UPF0755 protein